jgi:hypothetical protein
MSETIKEAYDRISSYIDPVLISVIRKLSAMAMAYDIIGVQPMSAPTGLIFTAFKEKMWPQAEYDMAQKVYTDWWYDESLYT